jgi:ABC-2 type transport system ATP-binding protein
MIKDLIAALAAEGRTIIYSSHVLDVVEKICDRVLVIHKGSLIAEGTPANLMCSTGQSTLEGVFRFLTDSAGASAGVSRIVASLRE